jgi:outer membrane biosynthesis protein TonB
MAAQQSMVLRLGVIQGGKIVEERILSARTAVTVGTLARNTIVVPISNLPESFTAFTIHGDRYHLCFEEGMEGRVQDQHASVELSELVAQGKARKEGKGHAVPVTEGQRGRLVLGEVTLLWQFVPQPVEAPRPTLPPDARGNHFRSMDRLFVTVLASSLLVHGGAYVALANTDLPPEVTIEQIPDRYAKLLVPDRLPAPPVEKKEEAKGPAEEKKSEEKKAEPETRKGEKKPESTEQVAARKAARAAAVAKAVQSKGMLKVLGALGPGSGGGAVSDVFGAGGGMTDVASALSGAGGVAVATDPGAGGGRKGGGQGGAASIGDLATSGGGAVAYGTKSEVKVTGTVATEAAEIDSSDIDQGKLGAFVRARMGLIKACYENALKRNPNIRGKVVIRFTILETGGVADVGASQNTLGAPEVASCIMNTMRSWRTQFRPSGPVTVEYPFLFTPSN